MSIFPFLDEFSPGIVKRCRCWIATIKVDDYQLRVFAGRDRYSTPEFCLPLNGRLRYLGVEVHLTQGGSPVDLAVFFPEGYFPPGSIQRYVPVATAAKIAALVVATKKVPV